MSFSFSNFRTAPNLEAGTQAKSFHQQRLAELSAAKEASLDEIWAGARKASVPNAQIWALLQNARDTQKIKKALQASVRDDAIAEEIALNEVIFAKLNQPEQPTRWRVLTGLGDGVPTKRSAA